MQFALDVMAFSKHLPRTTEGQVTGKQLLRSATSVAANYRAAGRARSRAEFFSKLSIVVEEADETLFWLEILKESNMVAGEDLSGLMQESRELVFIFSASRKTVRDNKTSPNH